MAPGYPAAALKGHSIHAFGAPDQGRLAQHRPAPARITLSRRCGMNTRRILCLLAAALLGAGLARSSGPEAQSGMAEVREPRLYYEMAGKGEAVVLIHGGGLDCRMWDGQFAALSRSHRRSCPGSGGGTSRAPATW